MELETLIETERLNIRYFKPQDIEDLFLIFSNPSVMKFVEPIYDWQKAEKFLQSFCIDKKGAVAVVHKQENKVIGYSLFNDRLEKDVYEIGWIFNEDYWRQGYAYESMSALIYYAFSECMAHKVWAEAIDGNKSVSLMKKLGMKYEGTQREHMRDQKGQWKDLYYYGLLKSEYKK